VNARARVEAGVRRMAERLIAGACRGLPEPERDLRYREWTAELPAILDDTDRVWVARLLILLTYAGDQQRGRTRTSGQLVTTALSALVGAVVGAVGGGVVGCLIGWVIQGVAADADVNDRLGGLFQGGDELLGGGLVGRVVLVVCMVVAGVGGGLVVLVGPSWRRATAFGWVVGAILALSYVGAVWLPTADFTGAGVIYTFVLLAGFLGLVGAVGYAVLGVVGSVVRWRPAALLGWVAGGLLLAGATLGVVGGWAGGGGLSLIGACLVALVLGGVVLRALTRGTARRRAVALGWAGGGALLAGGALGVVGSVVLPLAGGLSVALIGVGVGLAVTFGAVNTLSAIQDHRQQARR
jgi:hypothetical protein